MADFRFIVNEPWHKRWLLPDGIHSYNSVLNGDHFYITIWEELRNKLVLSLPPIKIDGEAGQWKDLLETSQALAEKRFAKRPTKAIEYSRTGDWRKR